MPLYLNIIGPIVPMDNKELISKVSIEENTENTENMESILPEIKEIDESKNSLTSGDQCCNRILPPQSLLPKYINHYHMQCNDCYTPERLRIEVDSIGTKENFVERMEEWYKTKDIRFYLPDFDISYYIEQADLPDDFFDKSENCESCGIPESKKSPRKIVLEYSENKMRNFLYALICSKHDEFIWCGYAMNAFRQWMDDAGDFLAYKFRGGVNGWGMSEMYEVATYTQFTSFYANYHLTFQNMNEIYQWVLLTCFSFLYKYTCDCSGEYLEVSDYDIRLMESIVQILYKYVNGGEVEVEFIEEHKIFTQAFLSRFLGEKKLLPLCVKVLNTSLNFLDEEIIAMCDGIPELKKSENLDWKIRSFFRLKEKEIDDIEVNEHYLSHCLSYADAISDIIDDLGK